MFFFFVFQDEIGLKEWSVSLRSAYNQSQAILNSMAKKAGKIYGTEREGSRQVMITGTGNLSTKNTNGNQRLLLRSRSCFIEPNRLKEPLTKLQCKDT